MIEVEVLSQNQVVWSAEAENEEAAVRAAQVGWDEAWDPFFSKSRCIRFKVDGNVTITLKERP